MSEAASISAPARKRRSRKRELHSEELPIEQKSAIVGDILPGTSGDIVRADDSVMSGSYLNNLKFMEEPVTIRLEGSREKNSATAIPIWCNGKGAEILINGKWREVTWLTVNQVITTKRKYVGILASSKLDEVTTQYEEPGQSARPRNQINRMTYAFQAFTVIDDPNPKGRAWLEEVRRRNFG